MQRNFRVAERASVSNPTLESIMASATLKTLSRNFPTQSFLNLESPYDALLVQRVISRFPDTAQRHRNFP